VTEGDLYRVGNGYDVHSLKEGRRLMLGCVHFDESSVGLDGHSDADVVAHAACDALLGAAGMGDIGEHFPPADPKYKDFPGGDFLQRVAEMIADAGYRIVNLDCVVMSDAVELGGRKKAMAATMAGHLGIDGDRVNVGATTHEGRGPVGRGEVIACQAVALIETA
jgi:2-C-methyl-D-erythritol 2,4-cyclodiphosphate synthase